MFETFYNSSAQQPLLLWTAILIGFLATVTQAGGIKNLGSLRKFALTWTIISFCDAWLTATPILGFGNPKSPWTDIVPLSFVIAGDYRYFYWSEGLKPQTATMRALGWSLLVPIASKLIHFLCPAPWDQNSRVLFFVYEVLFVGVAFLHEKSLLTRSALPEATQTWLRKVRQFVVCYYSLWALADLWILTSPTSLPAIKDLGFFLRLIPNLLYYGGLIPWIILKKPRSL